MNTAEQFEEQEQFDKAYEEYKKMYSQRPKSVEILERLGHLAMILDKKSEAQDYYKKILELDASNVLAYEQLMDIYVHEDKYKYYISRGNLHVLEGQLSHAINDFKKALDKAQTEEEMSSTRFVLANLYEQTGKLHPAIDEYLRIIDTTDAGEVVFLKLAQIYVQEDSIPSAVEILERALERGVDTPQVRENIARLYLKNNQTQKAREFTQDDLLKVKSLLDEENNEAAFEILEMVKDKNKKNPTFHSLMAQYYFNTKDFDKSLDCVKEFDKFEKNSPLTYQMQALIYEEKNMELEAHINWAKYNIVRGNRDVALNEYLTAYGINDSDIQLVQDIAELLEVMGEKTHAAEFFEKLIILDTKNKRALEKVAEFKESIGDYRAQIDVLEKLFELDSRNALVVKKLAGAYEKIKNKPKTIEYYNKFLSISPVNDEYNLIKNKVEKLSTVEMEEDEGLIEKLIRIFSKK